jgi:hypothetical protein
LKPILPPSVFFIPGYEGLQSDDSHDTEKEEERDDTPVRNCHNGGRDDIADDSTNCDIFNKGPDDIVNNKATKPIQTIRHSLGTSIRRSLRLHGKPTLRRSKRLIEFERSSQHPPIVAKLASPVQSEKYMGRGMEESYIFLHLYNIMSVTLVAFLNLQDRKFYLCPQEIPTH